MDDGSDSFRVYDYKLSECKQLRKALLERTVMDRIFLCESNTMHHRIVVKSEKRHKT